MSRLRFSVECVDANEWSRKDELAELIFDELYRDFDVDAQGPWWASEPGSVTAVAVDVGGRLVGSARLLPPVEGRGHERQVRQVAVAPAVRGAGVGRKLMDVIEALAKGEGAQVVVLDARDTAIEFYERLGYLAEGDTFVSDLTGIVHRAMRKTL